MGAKAAILTKHLDTQPETRKTRFHTMSTKPKKPKLDAVIPASLQTAKPLDWGKAFEALKYVQQDKHDGGSLHANADGSWMVIPTVRVYTPADDGKAEELARAFFESLKGEPDAQGTRKEPPNAASKAPGKGRTSAGAVKAGKSGKEVAK